MPWILNSSDGHRSYPTPAGETFYIVASVDNAGLTATRDAPDDASGILGTLGMYFLLISLKKNEALIILAVYSFGGKLEAGNADLIVSPPFARPSKNAQTRNDDPPMEVLVLQAKTETHVQTIILRHQDRIFSGAKSGGLTFEWKPPQIQVQSSEKKVEAAEGEEETEDDGDGDDPDNTVVPGFNKTQTMRSTPHLSISHSEIIQETPTIDRISEIGNLPSRTGRRKLRREPPVATPVVYSSASRGRSIPNDPTLPEESADADKSTASDTATPEPHIPEIGTAKSTKRSSLAKEDLSTPSARSSKRIKVGGTEVVTASALSARKTATKKRQSTTKADSTPSRSQHSTPASTATPIPGSPIDVKGDYDGPKPRVALSNSSIQPNSGFSRFLKRHGGCIVDSVDDCNILR
ncbi:hypothetical protein GRF29_44g403952 [Pseudopithomyces chartarum]|uniref:Uncharacterized protein n=1 Tax=Pseudopithomyces chartarum TaxID=1892770 RepID=A0AAN6RIX7_9PLEO|nr:hypothetical protein GRF29_44g403952 [Pseudopithomyces chartarum]